MKQNLAFNKGKFKILQLTDIHFVNNSVADQKTVTLMDYLIAVEKPDLIFLTGDFLTGDQNVTFAETALAPLIKSKIPWCFVYGNHDTEYGEKYEVLTSMLFSLPGCINYERPEDVNGFSNFTLELADSMGVVRWVLFGIDSNSYNQNPLVGGYDYIHHSQISWYRDKIRHYLSMNPEFGALSFFHIPLPEYNDVWNRAVCFGEKNENVCCSEQNSGLFTSMTECGHMRGTFVGHDHINDYWGELCGIRLCYGRATGYNTYEKEGFLRGGRVITISEIDTHSFYTYLRLSDHSIVKEQKKHLPATNRKDGSFPCPV